MREKLSIAIITRNGEKCIGRCLESVKWADEIVVLDGFSTDRTVEICRHYTDKVFQKKFENFSIERDWLLQKTSHRWVFTPDSDMVCPPEFCEEIRTILEKPKYDGYLHRVLTVFLNKEIRHCSWYDHRFLSLFNKEKGKYDLDMAVLDPFVLNNPKNAGKMKNHVLHFPEEDFITYFGKIKRYSFLTAHEYRRKLLRITPANAMYFFVAKPALVFLHKYIYKRGFLDGMQGILVSFNSMISYFVAYAALWDMQRTGNWSINGK